MAWMIGRRFEIACEKPGPQQAAVETPTDHFGAAESQRVAAQPVLVNPVPLQAGAVK